MKKFFTFMVLCAALSQTRAQVTILSQAVNPCGNDGQNEFIIASTGASGVNIADMAFGSANPASTATGCATGDPDFNFWWAGTNVNTNPFSIVGLAGSCASQTVSNSGGAVESYGFLYPSVAANNTTINSLISSLNGCLTCTVFLPVPSTNIIPAGSNFIVLLGAGICGLDAVCTNLNFTNWCSGTTAIQTLYVVVGAGDGGAGSTVTGGVCSLPSSGYFSNSSPRTQYSAVFNGGSNTVLANYSVTSQSYNPGSGPAAGNAGVATPGATAGASSWTNNQGCIPAPAVLAPLPISMTKFSATSQLKSTFLTWTTATEANNSYFAIERSANGKDFQTIGTVVGAGTSATEKNYQFTDATPLRGINYYRLKQMDFDGRSEYSEIKAVKMSSGGLVSLRPTEASEQLVITLQEAQIGNSELAIFDQLGRVIYRTNIAEGSLEALVNVSNFNAGAYFVRIGTGSESSVLRFIKIKD